MMGFFNLKKQEIPTPEEAFEEVLGSQINKNSFIYLSPGLLDEVSDQSFKIKHERVEQIAESIKRVGQLDACIVSPKENGRYDIVCGRHRARACKKLGIDVKCEITEVSELEKRYILLTSNLERNNEYLPSEYAAAYKEQVELLQKMGSSSATTSQIAKENNTSARKIQRYIRLNYLLLPLLKLVDSGELPFMAGVNLSYLSEKSQEMVFSFLLSSDTKLSVPDSLIIKRLEEGNHLDELTLKDALREQDESFSLQPAAVPAKEPTLNKTLPPAETKTTTTQSPETLPAEKAEDIPIQSKMPAVRAEKIKKERPAEKEPDATSHKSECSLPTSFLQQAIKQVYTPKKLFRYYCFEVPSSSTAIKEMLKPLNDSASYPLKLSHNQSGRLILNDANAQLEVESNFTIYNYHDLDKCIRGMIKNKLLIEEHQAKIIVKEEFDL